LFYADVSYLTAGCVSLVLACVQSCRSNDRLSKDEQNALPKPHHVSPVQGGRAAFHGMAVDIRPSAKVSEIVAIPVRVNLGMLIDDMRIVDTNIILRVTPDQDGKLIQSKTFPSLWAMLELQSSFPHSG
jgi:hypothetical protein